MSKLDDLPVRYEDQETRLDSIKETNRPAIVGFKKILKDLEMQDTELAALQKANSDLKRRFAKAMVRLKKYESTEAALLDGT